MGENGLASVPVALYGFVLLLSGFSYFLLTRVLLAIHDDTSPLAVALKRDVKGYISLACYISAVPLSFVQPWIAILLYALVALLWFIPDPRVERVIQED
jgi:uncharacterized membrane protein